MKVKVPAGNIKLKRAYEAPAPEDGMRILVDRLWPRGLSKQRAAIDQWMKDISPSTKLRKWFGHDPSSLGRIPPPLCQRGAPTPRAFGSIAVARAGRSDHPGVFSP